MIAPAKPGIGYLSINATPGWAEVYIDGKKLTRATPMEHVQLTAGLHHVRVHNRTLDRIQSFQLEIEQGKTVTRVVAFR